MLTVLTNIRSTKVSWWKTTFGGIRLSVDPCMLPTLLCGIFQQPTEWATKNFFDKCFVQIFTTLPDPGDCLLPKQSIEQTIPDSIREGGKTGDNL